MDRCIKALLFTAFILMLAGCGGDDDPKRSSKIVGKWQMTATDAEITAPGGDLRQYLIAELAMLPGQADSTTVRLESGEATTIDIATIDFKDDGTYTATGKGTLKLGGVWELTAGDKAVLFDEGTKSETAALVRTLADSELVVEFDLSDQIGLPKLKYLAIFSFEKI